MFKFLQRIPINESLRLSCLPFKDSRFQGIAKANKPHPLSWSLSVSSSVHSFCTFHSIELYCILSYFGVYSLILLGLFHLHLPILSDFHFCPNFHQIESDLIQTKIKGIPTLAARPSSLRFVLQDVCFESSTLFSYFLFWAFAC